MNKLKAVRVFDFDIKNDERPHAVCLDVYDTNDDFIESGTDWSYFETEKEAQEYIKQFNK